MNVREPLVALIESKAIFNLSLHYYFKVAIQYYLKLHSIHNII